MKLYQTKPPFLKCVQYSYPNVYTAQKILEIVDEWSTRIPPPHRRGWQWAMGGLQLNIVQNHKATILKATELTIVRLLPTATKDLHMKFETEIPKQTWFTLPKPCHSETEKSNMATRQPFRKWGHWKSIGSYPYKYFATEVWSWYSTWSQTKVSPETKKSNMAARRPFLKWRRWKSIGSYPYI